MECANTANEQKLAFYKRLRNAVSVGRIPINGTVEFTSRCNFRCVQCYNDISGSRNGELSTSKWKELLDQITDAGTLFLVITGGEPLLRKDFSELYEYAIRKGLITTCFTNGSLITQEIATLFKTLPPTNVEISMYGASEDVYKKVTGRSGMYERLLEGIQMLKENDISIILKTVLLKTNIHELPKIQEFAKKNDIYHRFDAAIVPRLDGDMAPSDERLDEEEIVNWYLSTNKLRNEWKKLYESTKDIPATDRLYTCGAAVNSFHINAQGWLNPCVMSDDSRFSLVNDSFEKGWKEKLPEIFEKRIAADSPCSGCTNHIFCNYCPATFRLETGSEQKAPSFFCKIGGMMAEKVYGNNNER